MSFTAAKLARARALLLPFGAPPTDVLKQMLGRHEISAQDAETIATLEAGAPRPAEIRKGRNLGKRQMQAHTKARDWKASVKALKRHKAKVRRAKELIAQMTPPPGDST